MRPLELSFFFTLCGGNATWIKKGPFRKPNGFLKSVQWPKYKMSISNTSKWHCFFKKWAVKENLSIWVFFPFSYFCSFCNNRKFDIFKPIVRWGLRGSVITWFAEVIHLLLQKKIYRNWESNYLFHWSKYLENTKRKQVRRFLKKLSLQQVV